MKLGGIFESRTDDLRLQQRLIDDLPDEFDIELGNGYVFVILKGGGYQHDNDTLKLKLVVSGPLFRLGSKNFSYVGLITYLKNMFLFSPVFAWLKRNSFKLSYVEMKASQHKYIVYETEVNDLPFSVSLDPYNGMVEIVYGETLKARRKGPRNKCRPTFSLFTDEIDVKTMETHYQSAKNGALELTS